MAGILNPGLLISLILVLLASGCAQAPVNTEQQEYQQGEEEAESFAKPEVKTPPPPKAPAGQTRKESTTVRRTITEKELRQLAAKDPDLEFYRCLEILCRLNKKDKEYIREDMKQKRPITVPKNFSSYKEWSPLPGSITGASKFPKLILVVKDIAFLGWYKNGKLVGDTYVCVGKMKTWTKRGIYRINAKDPSHMSTYPNAYGYPSFMPWALHVYDRVWIHAGDVIGPNCSHGCINVPIAHADGLYDWADVGTAVVITESLRDLGRDIKTTNLENQPNKAPTAKEQGKEDNKLKSEKERPKQTLGNSNTATTGGI
jgi:lipoprotein-anchoring transpeptidase ErfK/SrfK